MTHARPVRLAAIAFALATVAVYVGCGGSDDDSDTSAGSAGTAGSAGSAGAVTNTGQKCAAPTDCYPGLDGGTVKGQVVCLDKIAGGYCTHLCTSDADCCATPGECPNKVKEVCAPFESTGMMMCFVSCEDADVFTPDAWDAGAITPDQFCSTIAGTGFGCRSTGGGKANRKFCSTN